MFARAQRLRRSNDIITTLRTGNRARASFCELTHLPSPRPLQVAVIISKKVAPHAVDRNRMKRRVRPILKSLLPATGAWVFRFTQPIQESVSEEQLTAHLATCVRTAISPRSHGRR